MQIQDLLTEFAPELFNRIEPRRVGGKPDQFNLGQQCERVNYLLMGMDRPIIPDDVDLVYLALVGLVDLTEQVTNASASNDMISQLQGPSGAGIEGGDHAPLLGRRAVPIRQGNGSGRLFTPVGRRVRPTLIAHLIDEDRDRTSFGGGNHVQDAQQMRFFGAILWIGAIVLWPPTAQANAVAPQAFPDAGQVLETRQKRKGLLDRVQTPASGGDLPGFPVGTRRATGRRYRDHAQTISRAAPPNAASGPARS